MNTHDEEVVKRFDEKFPIENIIFTSNEYGDIQKETVSTDVIKSFLLSELHKREEMVRKNERERIKKSKIWKLVPDTPRMIMCSDKELDNLLSPSKEEISLNKQNNE
jgi:hypothetical protein